jgi:hypothetical protein
MLLPRWVVGGATEQPPGWQEFQLDRIRGIAGGIRLLAPDGWLDFLRKVLN